MISVRCEHCGGQFQAYPSAARRFCGTACRVKAMPCVLMSHGESRTRLHSIWCGMRTRCRTKREPFWTYYGSRGIAVCSAWDTYEAFATWARASGYSDSLELDRIDNDRGYSPDNCRWATRVQQMANTRKRRDGTTSRYRGVSWCANVGRWRVQLNIQKSHRHIGLFDSEDDAARAYDAAARQAFGEFASLNFKEVQPS